MLYNEYMQNTSEIRFLIGLNDEGENVYGDFRTSGNFISTGCTGSGHASFDEGAFVANLIQSYSPEELQFVMIDPKQVQLIPYEDIPHLWRPIAYHPDDARSVVQALIDETNRRYELLSSVGAVTPSEYCKKTGDDLPFIVLLATEIADLMMVDRGFYEKSFVWLTQRARGVGIHLYIATQRPSEDVLTDMILTRIQGRLVFGVANDIDSERLLGTADAASIRHAGRLIFIDQEDSPMQYVTANYVTDENVMNIVAKIAEGGK